MTDEFEDEPGLLELPDRPPDWSEEARKAADRAVSHGVSSEALAVYARWCQVENWLRLLLYLELRAKHGRDWRLPLPRSTPTSGMQRTATCRLPMPQTRWPTWTLAPS